MLKRKHGAILSNSVRYYYVTRYFYSTTKRTKQASSLAGKVKDEKPRIVKVPGVVSAKGLSKAMGINIKEIVKRMNITSEKPLYLKSHRSIIFSNQAANKLVEHFGMIPKYHEADLVRDRKQASIPDKKKLATKKYKNFKFETIKKVEPRAGIISVMGHIDHGKTTLLDTLRNTSVALHEAGGITQKLSAFSIISPIQNEKITFLDTPGHSAFFRMRRNGAFVSDLIYLIISVDEGVCSQTKESFALALLHKIPLIVLFNKIDLYPHPEILNAKISTIKMDINSQLAKTQQRRDLIKEFIPISAKNNLHLDVLESKTLEILKSFKLVTDSNRLGEGTVIESFLNSRGVGVVILMVVHTGKLSKNDYFISGLNVGRISKIWKAGTQEEVNTAYPSDAIEITGLKTFRKKDQGKKSGLPNSGESVFAVSRDKILEVQVYRELCEDYEKTEGKWDNLLLKSIQNDIDYPNGVPRKKRKQKNQVSQQEDEEEEVEEEEEEAELEEDEKEDEDNELEEQETQEEKKNRQLWEDDEDEEKELKLVLKADNLGSLHALGDALASLTDNDVKMEVVHAGVGDVIQKDVNMAKIFKCKIWAFNVGKESGVRHKEDVEVVHHNVHYEMIADLKKRKEQKKRELAKMRRQREIEEEKEHD